MKEIKGTYENGEIKLERKIRSKKKMNVVVTFLEESEQKIKRLTKEDFSFDLARRYTKNLKSSLAESVIEDRRSEL